MIAFAGKCLAYTEGMDQHSFVSSALTYDATLRNLELIGEAATRVPDEVPTGASVRLSSGGPLVSDLVQEDRG